MPSLYFTLPINGEETAVFINESLLCFLKIVYFSSIDTHSSIAHCYYGFVKVLFSDYQQKLLAGIIRETAERGGGLIALIGKEATGSFVLQTGFSTLTQVMFFLLTAIKGL